jgi:hypothetical protein
MPVESFFQDNTNQGLIAQVQWAEKELQLSDEFFSNFLQIPLTDFNAWKRQSKPLEPTAETNLRYLWRVVLHVLSFLNFNMDLTRVLLVSKTSSHTDTASPFDPPWTGTSMKAYLEASGLPALISIDRWIQGIRFPDRPGGASEAVPHP